MSQKSDAYRNFYAGLSPEDRRGLNTASRASGQSIHAVNMTDINCAIVDVMVGKEIDPALIAEAKIDGNCPECGKPGTFGDDGGLCLGCGFSY
ncbi:MAG TPA: hypothetical protein VMW15_14720 [Terracidiphilus sp.]|nr:hypothetical protein [Terracidiphilus sp.]